MKKRIFAYVIILTIILSLLTSCDKSSASDASGTAAGELSASSDNTAMESAAAITGQYSDKDIESSYDESSATKITFNGSSITIDGSGAKAEEEAEAEGSVLTVSAGGTYILSGELSDGQIVVTAAESDDVRLVFNGVNINCTTGAPIYAAAADKLIITLAEGTENTITDGGSNFTYADASAEEPNAAIFAKCDLSINGTGVLTVNAGFNNGIGTKDDLVIACGTLIINAKNDGLRGRDSVTILDGDFDIIAGGDGIQSNNNEDSSKGWISLEGGVYNIIASSDGVQAETVLSVSGGEYSIEAGGGSEAAVSTEGSFKGLKAAGDLAISSGTLVIDSADDCIHANGNIAISSGDLTLTSGDDGVHTDMDLSITGGNLDVTKSYEGVEGATATISGGEIKINSTDDAINAAGGDDLGAGGGFGKDAFSSSGSSYINISGGTIYFTAGGDGIDSNGDINISGGTITAFINSSMDNGAIDCDGTFTATGGTIVYGGTGIGFTPSASSTQSYVLISSGLTANSEVTVKKDGVDIVTATMGIDCQSLAISTPDIVNGESYDVYSGDTPLSTVTAGVGGGMGAFPGGGQDMPGGGGGGGGGQVPPDGRQVAPGGGQGGPGGEQAFPDGGQDETLALY